MEAIDRILEYQATKCKGDLANAKTKVRNEVITHLMIGADCIIRQAKLVDYEFALPLKSALISIRTNKCTESLHDQLAALSMCRDELIQFRRKAA